MKKENDTMQTTDTTQGFLNKRGAARFTGLAPRTLDAAKARGELPFVRFSSRLVLFRAQDLSTWLNKRLVSVPASDDCLRHRPEHL